MRTVTPRREQRLAEKWTVASSDSATNPRQRHSTSEWTSRLSYPEKSSSGSSGEGCKRNLVAEALELSEAPALEAFGAMAVEVVSAKVAVSGRFGQQVVGDFEDM